MDGVGSVGAASFTSSKAVVDGLIYLEMKKISKGDIQLSAHYGTFLPPLQQRIGVRKTPALIVIK